MSKGLPEQISGLFHAGSVGIIMSGWLGAVNYGVIVSNDVDKYLTPAAASVKEETQADLKILLVQLCRASFVGHVAFVLTSRPRSLLDD